MKTKKNAKLTRAAQPNPTGDTHIPDTTDSKAIRRGIQAEARVSEEPTPESFTKHIERQTLRAFLDAVHTWGLSDADSARLVGAELASVNEWKTGDAPTNEEVLARMAMVALIETALDIAFPSSLSSQWMTSPNSGYPYLGLSPVAYVGKHGWPGLFFVLRQTQGHALGY
jgi:hypothetical protein